MKNLGSKGAKGEPRNPAPTPIAKLGSAESFVIRGKSITITAWRWKKDAENGVAGKRRTHPGKDTGARGC